MIGDCPSTWVASSADKKGAEAVAAFCRRQVDSVDEFSYLMDVPVTSTATNRTYVNTFCARCNSDSEHLMNVVVALDCSDYPDR